MRVIILLSLWCVFACDAAPQSPTASSPTTRATTNDMCAEHGVLMSLCPKHQPALIAVFQAKGDWCDEHGFPESFCPQCHPERGGRPAQAISDDDGAPADGTKVTLKSAAVAQAAGIVSERATARDDKPVVTAVARVVYDASRTAAVTARADGVVRELKVDVGARVKRGQALAIIDSADVGRDRGALTAARARLRAAEATLARQQDTHAQGITAQKDLDAAIRDRDAIKADVAALESALAVVGNHSDDASSSYVLTAPLGGVVTERNVTVGQSVTALPVLFQVVDASSLWAELDVRERDAAIVRDGHDIALTLDSLPDRVFTGTISYVAPTIDHATRTVRARAALPNVDGALRAQMYGTANIAVDVARSVVTVPAAAVQRMKDTTFVFIETAPGAYVARRVVVSANRDGAIDIERGVTADDLVVTTGSFLLKTETMKGAIGAGCCE